MFRTLLKHLVRNWATTTVAGQNSRALMFARATIIE